MLVHLPPPYIGPAVINRMTLESEFLGQRFSFEPVSVNTSTDLREIGGTSVPKVFMFFSIVGRVLQRLLQRKYALVYMSLTPTGIGFYKDCLLVLLVKLFGVKRVYHLHGKGIARYQDGFHRFLYRWCFRKSSVILISEKFFEEIRTYVPRKDVSILPNSVAVTRDQAYVQNLIRQRRQHTRLSLLFLSNMVRSKGVFVALEAAQRLKQKGHAFFFYFAGDWCDITPQEFSDTVERLSLQKEVIHKGFLPFSEKEKLWEEADIFVFPTYNDIFGIVNLEAMHYALPVVSTYEGAIPEIIDDGVTGFLVPPRDPRALAEKLEVLMNDAALRERLGEAGRRKVEQQYTFNIFEQKLSKILQNNIA